jgi:hypothetical protein
MLGLSKKYRYCTVLNQKIGNSEQRSCLFNDPLSSFVSSHTSAIETWVHVAVTYDQVNTKLLKGIKLNTPAHKGDATFQIPHR